MRKLLTLSFALLVMMPLAWEVATAQEELHIYGFSYFVPPEGAGTVTTLVASLDPPAGFSYPFTVDFTNNEYTFYFQSTITSVAPGPVTTAYSYADADFFIYEDPSKNGDYGTYPPNGTSPSTFLDGTLVLRGTLSNVTRIDYNLGFPEPTIVADCTFTGGTGFSELLQGNNWTFTGGLSSSSFLGIPEGYQRNWATKIIFTGPLPVDHSSWGAIKALYMSE